MFRPITPQEARFTDAQQAELNEAIVLVNNEIREQTPTDENETPFCLLTYKQTNAISEPVQEALMTIYRQSGWNAAFELSGCLRFVRRCEWQGK